MSESEEHRNLVRQVACALTQLFSGISIVVDFQLVPGHPVPPVIGGHRPDLYGTVLSTKTLVVAEAKTDFDLDNRHTYSQVSTFIEYLELKGGGLFVLSVTGRRADRAKTVLRFIYRQKRVSQTNLSVFDGIDFWYLDPTEGTKWHLS